MRHFDVLIVGAGHGGAQAAILLRQHGFDGSLGLVWAEAELPYERPPLSKDYLAGTKTFERMLIRPESFWAERRIALQPATRIAAVDASARLAFPEEGRPISWGTMIWAAGGAPRRLACAGADLEGVHFVRSKADCDAIRTELAGAARVAVVGGGYIGLETAAVVRGLGKQVTLVEMEDRLLSRVAAPDLSRFYEAEHRAQGVDLRLSARVESIEGADGRARVLRLAGGETIETDLVIAGIGIAPEVQPLLDAGARGTDGVEVDELCRTSLAGVHAIGDCAAHRNHFAGGARIRLESVQNAHDQAATAVKSILGAPEPYRALPWFWSNQYDLRLQTVGLSHGCDRTLLRGSFAERSFSIVHLREGKVAALDCVNATRDYAQGRRLVLAGVAPDPAALADPSVPLKSLVPRGEEGEPR